MKTIKELKDKWWYRLIKIVYIAIFLFVSASSTAFIFYASQPVFDRDNSYVLCSDGRIIDRVGLDINDIYFSPTYISSDDDLTIRKLCLNEPSYVGRMYLADKNYEIIFNYIPRNWFATIIYPLLSILIVVLLLEAFRRLFYYVVLGSFFPDRPKRYFFFKTKFEEE